MKIRLVLEVPDGAADPDNTTGLTSDAYDELTEAIADCGFAFVSGPDKVGG